MQRKFTKDGEIHFFFLFFYAFPYPGETDPGAQTTKECLHDVHAAQASRAQHAQTGEQSEAQERQQH